jgi:hypothetical protein
LYSYVCMYVFAFEGGAEIVRGYGVSSSAGGVCVVCHRWRSRS